MDDLPVVLERIHALAIPDEDEPDPPPSPELIARTIELCKSAAVLMRHPFLRAAVYADEECGISLYWTMPHKRAVTVSLANDSTHDLLYHRDSKSKESAFEQPFTPELLAQWLDWYAEGTASGATTTEEHPHG